MSTPSQTPGEEVPAGPGADLSAEASAAGTPEALGGPAPESVAGTDRNSAWAGDSGSGRTGAVTAKSGKSGAVIFPGVLEMTRSLMVVLVVALFILTFIVQPFRIPSESMERTLLVGDFLLVNKAVFAPAGPWGWLLPYQKIQRGDVVVFHFPPHPPEHVVKRVIGLPGDHVRLENGLVWVNERLLYEPYAVFEPAAADDFRDNYPTSLYTDPEVSASWWATMRHDVQNGELVVPPGEYFVLGDNRNFSLDSRYWGFVPADHIVGRPFVIYFSLREPSATDLAELPDDRLGQKNDPVDRIEEFARWNRFMRVVR